MPSFENLGFDKSPPGDSRIIIHPPPSATGTPNGACIVTRRQKSSLSCASATIFLLSSALVTMVSVGFFMWQFHPYSCHVDDKPSPRPELLDGKTAFSFDDIFDPNFRPKGFDGRWMQDLLVYRDTDGAVKSMDPKTKKIGTIMDANIFSDLKTSTYTVSPDLQYVLLATNRERVWRHSYNAVYKIYDVKASRLLDFPNDDNMRGKPIQLVRWSSTGHSLTFVSGNNLYHQADPENAGVEQITSTGDLTYIFNGIADWMYEEDVLGTAAAHYWSPDNRQIVFAVFNDTKVPLVEYELYGSPYNAYGSLYKLAYPKSGDITADDKPGHMTQVELFITRPGEKGEPQKIEPPAEYKNRDHYYTGLHWLDNTHVWITWTNRVQNHSIVTICDTVKVECTKHYERSVVGGWIDAPAIAPRFIDGGENYITIISKDVGGDAGAYKQVALVSSTPGQMGRVVFLTSAMEEVSSIVGYDEERKLVYFISTNGDPTERHLNRVGTPFSDPKYFTPECLTCEESEDCQYVSARFNSKGSYYVLNCRGPAVPSYELRNVDDGEDSMILEDNKALKELRATKALGTRTFQKIPLDGVYEGDTELWTPPNHKKNQKHPLLIFTYGAPGFQKVLKTFAGGTISLWFEYLMSTHGIAVGSVNHRGSEGDGDKIKFEIYRRLATVEVEDQITAALFFKQLGIVDTDKRAAIFGWSYGGQTTSHVLGSDRQVLTCGAAVAPSISQTWYNSAYIERYMGLATREDNAVGYNNTNTVNKAAGFRGKKYLIAHGTHDDNVHFRQTAEMIRALSDLEIQFRQLVYVDENHDIGHPSQSRHLFRALTNFLLEDCWEVKPEEES